MKKLINTALFLQIILTFLCFKLNGSKPKDEKDARGNTALYRASQVNGIDFRFLYSFHKYVKESSPVLIFHELFHLEQNWIFLVQPVP